MNTAERRAKFTRSVRVLDHVATRQNVVVFDDLERTEAFSRAKHRIVNRKCRPDVVVNRRATKNASCNTAAINKPTGLANRRHELIERRQCRIPCRVKRKANAVRRGALIAHDAPPFTTLPRFTIRTIPERTLNSVPHFLQLPTSDSSQCAATQPSSFGCSVPHGHMNEHPTMTLHGAVCGFSLLTTHRLSTPNVFRYTL